MKYKLGIRKKNRRKDIKLNNKYLFLCDFFYYDLFNKIIN